MAKKKTIRGILIDAEHCTIREVEFENTLESYYWVARLHLHHRSKLRWET